MKYSWQKMQAPFGEIHKPCGHLREYREAKKGLRIILNWFKIDPK